MNTPDLYAQLCVCVCVKMSEIMRGIQHMKKVQLANYVAVRAPLLHPLYFLAI